MTDSDRYMSRLPVESGYDVVVAGGGPAGTAPVQAVRTGQPACELDTAALVETLRANGAILPQADLSPQMTRTG